MPKHRGFQMTWNGLIVLVTLAGLMVLADAQADVGRGIMLIDFEEGTAPLQSYAGEDFEPDAWEIQSDNTYNGTSYALRIWGNSWKELPIEPYPLSAASVFEVAIYAEELGELQAFAFGDSTENELFYTVAGEQLVLSDRWNVTYQGAYPLEQWRAYLLPVGQDWLDTWGYLPEITRLIFVNDHDNTHDGKTVFDEVYDVTEDMPLAPQVEIQRVLGAVEQLPPSSISGGDVLYRVLVEFQSLVYDPDSDEHTYCWDFGDGAASADPHPTHEFTAAANYTFTIALDVWDESGLFGRDTCQVMVEPSGQGGFHSINFTGDVFMGRGYDAPGGLIDTYGVDYLFEPTLGILGQAADITMINAEVPFTDRGVEHPTKSVVFRTRPENITGLVYAGVDVASLGNNHIIDYGIEGLLQTEAMFDSVGIVRGGAGVNSYFATQPCYYTHEGVRLGFINFCNRTGREYNYQPFLEAGYEKCGFGYWLQPEIGRAIGQADSLADIVIAFPHSGEEYYAFPPPESGQSAAGPVDPEICPPYVAPENAPDVRFRIWPGMTDRELRWNAVDLGADVVINSHPHVLQGFEVYNGVLIAHSMGNFMFDLSYIETLPTIVLRALFDKEGLFRWTYKPVFIDHWIPVPASGRLGREILDRMADYSRVLGATVGVDPEFMTGVIFVDPATAIPAVTDASGGQMLHEDGDHWVSLPIVLAGEGNLSRILDVTGVDPQDCEICWGREMLWFGRFEQDEGYHMWNLNSSDEWLDDDEFYEGAHALALHRAHDANDNVVTNIDRHLPADSLRYSLCGWMKTENAHDARFSLRFYRSRYNWNPIETIDMGDPIEGDSDWTWYARDCTRPEDGDYWNIRCNLDRPSQGDAYAYFDDLRVVEWLPWQALELPLDVPYPNNYRFLQIRVPDAADSVTVAYEETALTDGGYAVIADRDPQPPVGAFLRGAAPNPFRGATTIAYRLNATARVSLEVYDVAGRMVSRLAQDDLQRPGWHRVQWEPTRQTAGIYFSRLTVNGDPQARKMVLLK